MESQLGTLFIVSTPIGNLLDISPRALECLNAVNIIACEDTRHSAKLLNKYEIQTRRVSLHKHNEASRTAQLIDQMSKGQNVAYITDAGTPLISDPGSRLVHLAATAGCEVAVVPGPSAVTAALSGSGFPADRFYFGGFLSTKKKARKEELHEALQRKETSIFFDSPYRIASTLDILSTLDTERLIVVARELTKKFEEFKRGTAPELAKLFSQKPVKGEIVIIISGAKPPRWLSSKET
ncbi:MAG: 16S rRNA (cytidine(1402)-2'-O)-methyltransferase [Verrucomicrobiota bacterium]|nr:16S rRNA (cytidine(1402)-2'-O)-methyltransferase [Verrucomicrobiota bacterium]